MEPEENRTITETAKPTRRARKRRPSARAVRRRSDVLLGCFFVLFLAVFLVLHLVIRDKDMSEQENRSLAQLPAITSGGITSGSFMDKFEAYMADQFPGRNLWRNLNVAFEWFGGSREENGVYLGKDGQLMETLSVPEKEDLDKTISSLNSFAKANSKLNTSFLIVPDSANVLSSSLPPLATTADQNEQISDFYSRLDSGIRTIDIAETLAAHSDEKLFYKTDHHWTTLGALYGYLEYEKALGLTSTGVSPSDLEPAADDFTGVLASLSGFCQNTKEIIDVYIPHTPVLVSYVDEQAIRTSVFDTSYLDVKDKYGLFLGGNHSLIDITTGSGKGRTLLLIKDSFANCFLPFLTEQYDRIIVADPRYCSDTVDEILASYPVTDVLFLFRGNTIFGSRFLAGFLAG